VLAALLAPLVGRLERARIPAPVGATLLLLGTVALVVGTGLALSGPVQDWARKTPEAIAAAGKKVQAFRHRFDRLNALLTPPAGASSPVALARRSALSRYKPATHCSQHA